jgi:phage terminase large subunit GpA-like protein
LDQLLDRRWPNCVSRQLPISLTAIDAGYSTDDVLQFARRYSSSRLIAVRGISGDAAPRIARIARERNEKLGTPLKYSKRFFNVGVNVFKLALYKDLAKDDPALPGYISFPRDLPDRFYQEIVSEQRVAHKRMGQIVWKWEKPDRQANECLDCTVYASAAAIKYGANWISDVGWRKLTDELETPPPPLRPGEKRVVQTRAQSIAEQLPQ